MKRREFLKLPVAAAVVATVPALAKEVVSPVAMGVDVAKKGKMIFTSGNVIASSHAKALWPGIEKWYKEQYDAIPR